MGFIQGVRAEFDWPPAREQLTAEILDAISSGRGLYVFDQFIGGPDRLERARKVLIEKRDACPDPDEAAFLTSIIRGLEKGWGICGQSPRSLRDDLKAARHA